MTDFSHLSKLQIEVKTVNYDIEDLVGQPSLQVLPATEGNKAYFNAALKSQRKNRTASNKNIDAAFIEKGREKDKDLYSKYIIKGWSGVLDTQGNVVEFSIGNVTEFLVALPNYIFDDLRDFCQNPKNFTSLDDDEEAVEDVVEN